MAVQTGSMPLPTTTQSSRAQQPGSSAEHARNSVAVGAMPAWSLAHQAMLPSMAMVLRQQQQLHYQALLQQQLPNCLPLSVSSEAAWRRTAGSTGQATALHLQSPRLPVTQPLPVAAPLQQPAEQRLSATNGLVSQCSATTAGNLPAQLQQPMMQRLQQPLQQQPQTQPQPQAQLQQRPGLHTELSPQQQDKQQHHDCQQQQAPAHGNRQQDLQPERAQQRWQGMSISPLQIDCLESLQDSTRRSAAQQQSEAAAGVDSSLTVLFGDGMAAVDEVLGLGSSGGLASPSDGASLLALHALWAADGVTPKAAAAGDAVCSLEAAAGEAGSAAAAPLATKRPRTGGRRPRPAAALLPVLRMLQSAAMPAAPPKGSKTASSTAGHKRRASELGGGPGELPHQPQGAVKRGKTGRQATKSGKQAAASKGKQPADQAQGTQHTGELVHGIGTAQRQMRCR